MARLKQISIITLTLVVLGTPLTSQAAESDEDSLSKADLSSCGDIHVEASAECELIPPGVECDAECSDISFEAACDAKLAVECEGECDISVDADCSADCRADCEADCELEPGEFDCSAACNADCSASCEGQCEADEDSASCEGRCEASCSASCDAECDVDLPSADCDVGCEASCQGSCKAEANFDCQISCQREAYAECEAELQGGCEVACDTEKGALICDSEYVDYGNNFDECVSAIEAVIDAHVEARGTAGCEEDGTCSAEGSVKCECSTAPGQSSEFPAWATLSLAFGLAFMIRRKFHR